MYPFLLALSLLAIPSALGYNITIDDTFSSPDNSSSIVYSPVGVWTYGPNCTECTAKPNISLTYMNSWRDASQFGIPAVDVNATITFNGTGVAVYGILDKTQSTATDLTFTIDGVSPGTNYYFANQDPAASPPLQYNVQFFAMENLAAGVHTLVLEVGDPDAAVDGKKSTVLLDYITYTVPDPPPPAKSHTPVIIGVVVAAVVLIILFAGVFWFMRRRSRLRGPQATVPAHTPFLLIDTRQDSSRQDSTFHDNDNTSQGHCYESPTTTSMSSEMPPQRGVSLMVENQILREVLVRQWARPSPELERGGDLPPYDHYSASSAN